MIRAITAIGRGRSDGCKWVQCHENPSWKASEWGQQKLHLYFRKAGTKWGRSDWIKGEKECHVFTFSCVGDPMSAIWTVMIAVWYIWVPLTTGLEPLLAFVCLTFIHYLSNIKCLKWKSERFKKKKNLKIRKPFDDDSKSRGSFNFKIFFNLYLWFVKTWIIFWCHKKKKVHYALLTCICSIIILFYIQ